MLTFLCGTGHVVYTMFPIIADIALKKGSAGAPYGRGVGRVADGDHGLPVSVAVVSLVSILAAQHGIGHAWGILEILAVSVPASLFGVAIAALWSLRRGKDLADDMEFQEKLKDPKQREFIYGGTETLMNQRFPKQAYWSTWIFFAGIAVVVLLGAFLSCAPPLN
jgi:anaerobic C4-dicarboxylate transporter DcuB